MVSHALTTAPDDCQSWLAGLAGQYTAEQLALLTRAAGWLSQHADRQASDSGAPLLQHSLGAAAILAGMQFDADTVAAALVSGLSESQLSRDRLGPVLGDSVGHLAQGAARLHQMDRLLSEVQGDGVDQSEALRQMLLAMTDDIRVVLIKLAERTQALRELATGDEQRRHKVAQDARDLYAPLANRIGVWQLKWELEDMACRYLEPDTYKHIARLLDERRLDREWYIEQVLQNLGRELVQAGIEGAEVSGRPKHIASILAKMRKKHLDFEEVYDVRAVRVLVRDLKDCYHALGLIHSLWQPIPGQFDDYISRPKGNGYRSLHTAVIGPEGKALEVQIRTYEMHREAELGVAAHWRYKEGGPSDPAFDAKIAIMRQLLETADDELDDQSLLDSFRSVTSEDRVYALTPKGQVVDLSAGSSVLDFAYQVHTEIGHRCRGAKVNGRIVPLTHVVHTGDRIEILTAKHPNPSRDWLNPKLGFINGARARSKVRQWFKRESRDDNLHAGKEALEAEARRMSAELNGMEPVLKRFKLKSVDDLYVAIGSGDLNTGQVFNAMARSRAAEIAPQAEDLVSRAPARQRGAVPARADDIVIEGVGNLMTTLAKCCHPVPGDPVVGYVTRGRGVTIHREDCRQVVHWEAEASPRLLQVRWGEKPGASYVVHLLIRAFDRVGLLADLASNINQSGANILSANTETRENQQVDSYFTIAVENTLQLKKVIAAVRRVKLVQGVKRIEG